MSKIDAIVLDLDGTLLRSDKTLSPRNYEAVKSCFNSGVHIIVATARPPRVARQFIEQMPFVDYILFYNGALVTCESKQIQRHFGIPMDVNEKISKFIAMEAPQSFISYEVNDCWYTSTVIPDSECIHYGIRPHDPKPELVDNDFINSLSPTKILVLGCNSWEDIIEQFGDAVNVIATDGGALVQIMDKSASKEDVVQWVLNDMGVISENVMVFGDYYNDLGLFHAITIPYDLCAPVL